VQSAVSSLTRPSPTPLLLSRLASKNEQPEPKEEKTPPAKKKPTLCDWCGKKKYQRETAQSTARYMNVIGENKKGLKRGRVNQRVRAYQCPYSHGKHAVYHIGHTATGKLFAAAIRRRKNAGRDPRRRRDEGPRDQGSSRP